MKKLVAIYRKHPMYPDPVFTKGILVTDEKGDTDRADVLYENLVSETKDEFVKKFPEFKNANWHYELLDVSGERVLKKDPVICKHCGSAIYKDGEHWKSELGSEGTSQFCFIDPVHGSRLHVPNGD